MEKETHHQDLEIELKSLTVEDRAREIRLWARVMLYVLVRWVDNMRQMHDDRFRVTKTRFSTIVMSLVVVPIEMTS